MSIQELPLNEFPMGKKAKVVSLKSDGADRRRILDLGIINGTEIEPLYRSPSGNPVAYRIRGAVIALRTDVSKKIEVITSGEPDISIHADRKSEGTIVALAGNPNVGKSTVFNALTGLNQHTGNWPGKTVVNARGKYQYKEKDYTMVDIPGTYSLMSTSTEEEIARDFICFGQPDVTVVVADATCLERNLNLVLQIMEITNKVVLCVNLLDEAKKKKIRIDLEHLSFELGIPVVGTSARSGKGLDQLMESVRKVAGDDIDLSPLRVTYGEEIEQAISIVVPVVDHILHRQIDSRWLAIKLLDADETLLQSLESYLGYSIMKDVEMKHALEEAESFLRQQGFTHNTLRDQIVAEIVEVCENIRHKTVIIEDPQYNLRDRKMDKILTSKRTGIPIMICMLFAIFWFTIAGANVPSALLADGLFALIEPLKSFFTGLLAPVWLTELLVDGVYKTLAWVISVMLPPMAIFFPLFTLLEDLGYLPRVAFNLDNYFRKANAHGKQSLTMCMALIILLSQAPLDFYVFTVYDYLLY